jgi:hypothetical protein
LEESCNFSALARQMANISGELSTPSISMPS